MTRQRRRSGCGSWLVLGLAIGAAVAYWQVALPVLVALFAGLVIYGAYHAGRRRRIATSLGELYALSPEDFEEVVAALLVGLGWYHVSVTGRSGDHGCDVLGTDPQGQLVVVQCKRYMPSSEIGSPVVQLVIGSVVIHEADRAMVVTTAGRFTAAATELAAAHDVELVAGARLASMALQARGLTE